MLKTRTVLIGLKRKLSAVNTARAAVLDRMQAWQIHSYGDLNELQLSNARIPIIRNPTDVLVKVDAASINPIDKMIIGGYGRELLGFLRNYELEFPLTLGRDFAGTIIDKGHDVGDEFKVGDSVYGALGPPSQGSLAETVICCKEMICHRPSNISPVEVTSMTYAAMTAWSALFLTGELNFRSPKHSKVLVLGASGGVGTVAVQMLKSQGATVIGTCSSDAVPLVKSLGADCVFDYRDKNYISDVASAALYDIILDCAKFGYQNIPSTWSYRRFVTLNSPLLLNSDKYGLIGGLAASANDILSSNLPRLIQGKTVRWGFFAPSNNGLKFINKLIQDKKIKPVIHKVFKFNEVPAAFEAMAAGHLRGKIVIDFN